MNTRALKKAKSLFNQAAADWIHGNNSGNSDIFNAYTGYCHQKQREAENILILQGITVYYPGLNPVYEYQGREYTDIDGLIKWGGLS